MQGEAFVMCIRRQKHPLTLLIPLFTTFLVVSSFIFTPSALAYSSHARASSSPTNYAGLVDPLVGTGQQALAFHGGDTFPGADVPFGMVQWSPDTNSNPDGGYTYSDNTIKGFGLTHISGAGCNIYGDIPFMPYVGTVSNSPASNASTYMSTFSHSNETAAAGYYQVRLNNGVTTQLTATQHSGAGSFTYPSGQTATMLVNVSGSSTGVSNAQVNVGSDTISGSASSGNFCGASDTYTVYFWAQFSQPFATTGTWSNSTLTPGSTSASGSGSGAFVTFNTSASTTIGVRVGISFVSVANAQANVNQEDPTGNFAPVQAQAEQAWNTILGEIQVSGGTANQETTFYTALYHALLHPNVFSDVNGQYIGFDGQVHSVATGHAQYANFSGWDIYRSEVQLLTLLAPTQASDIAQSMVNDYTQSGQFPKWSLANGETYIMIGDPADAILADIYAFGGTNFDTQTALTDMIKEATVPNNVRPGLNWLETLGYLPRDGSSSSYGCCNFNGTAATTLEYNTADFSLGAFAQALGDGADSQTFINRAQDWRNLFNSFTKYLEPRNQNGSYPFFYIPESEGGWVEGDGSQYTWLVPFNLRGLFDAMGGNSSVVSRLNSFFTVLNAGPVLPNAYIGNEVSLETPWEYDYAGAPYRTQSVVRQAVNSLFTTGPGGLPGNDDLGETSSWYVFAALGMYPETPGTANLALASPLFPNITIDRPSGQVLQINAPGASVSTYYVQSLTVNGQVSTNPWLAPSFIAQGGTLNYTLSTSANTLWGSAASDAPPSYQ
jgi:predicted alpha-1,2-mannosidase